MTSVHSPDELALLLSQNLIIDPRIAPETLAAWIPQPSSPATGRSTKESVLHDLPTPPLSPSPPSGPESQFGPSSVAFDAAIPVASTDASSLASSAATPQYASRLTCEEMLRQHGVNPCTLSPPQIKLFRIADLAQKQRLVELWTLYPPDALQAEYPSLAWTESSLEQEENLAFAQHQRQQQQQERDQKELQDRQQQQYKQKQLELRCQLYQLGSPMLSSPGSNPKSATTSTTDEIGYYHSTFSQPPQSSSTVHGEQQQHQQQQQQQQYHQQQLALPWKATLQASHSLEHAQTSTMAQAVANPSMNTQQANCDVDMDMDMDISAGQLDATINASASSEQDADQDAEPYMLSGYQPQQDARRQARTDPVYQTPANQWKRQIHGTRECDRHGYGFGFGFGSF